MENFYEQWLKRFDENRRRYLTETEGAGEDVAPEEENVQQTLKDPSEVVYETDSLKLIIEKSSFKRQKVFRLQDHLFKFKIVPKNLQEHLPLLSDLFDFLHAALLHVLESIKTFYKKEDHNIAYLTLHQEPMVNGLNTGLYKSFGLVDFILHFTSEYALFSLETFL